jgi:outer membrane protein insertion porin family
MRTIYLAILVFILWGCNATKHLPPGEELYTGPEVRINPVGDVKHKKALKKDLEKALGPKPNSSILGLRPKVWVYNTFKTEKEKGFKAWLRKTLGEKPVLLSDVDPQKMVEVLMSRMESKGYFKSLADYKVIHGKNRKAKVLYTAKARPQFIIHSIALPEGDDTLSRQIRASMDKTLLETGDPYDLDKLKQERERIDARLKNQGYYFFNPQYLHYKVDTTLGNHRLGMKMEIKEDIPPQARQEYRLNDIFVFTNYSLSRDSAAANAYGVRDRKSGYYFVNDQDIIRTNPVAKNIFLSRGNVYSRRDHNLTLARLMGMGIFKFVDVKIQTASPPDSVNKLDALIYLTPMDPKSLKLELLGVTKSNNYTGPVLNASFRNRSAFRGAELFILNLKAGFETQFGQRASGLGSYELGVNTDLVLPTFVSPFRIKRTNNTFVPKTKFDLGFSFLRRIQYYSLNSFSFSYGYRWREVTTKEHELSPVAITYVHLSDSTHRFNAILDRNPFLRKSFRDQFILGSVYSFTYNNQVYAERKHQFYFNSNLDLSGNLFHSLQDAFGGRTREGEFRVLGKPYSQYSKLTLEGRYTLKLNQKSSLATRLIAGAGVPYGNSDILPYIKQYFIGGANSIRAFRARSLGPGSYILPDTLYRAFSDQSGDLKLEGNIEYRFDIISVLKGAFFIDAGNIWILKDNPSLPGGKFNAETFTRDIAAGTGTGVRVDISFIVVRLDVAFPIRKPSVEGESWILKKIKLSDATWRRENLLFNFAVGYPF